MKLRNNAFTLSEVLIALALLGIIAAFAIPKVLQATGETQQKAQFQEIYSILSEIYYKAYLDGDLNRFATGNPAREPMFSYMHPLLNSVKVCTTGLKAGGCRTTTIWNQDMPGVLLHNGSTISFTDFAGNDFIIDVNGDAKPNVMGQDILHLVGASTSSGYCGIKFGQIGAPDPVLCPTWQQTLDPVGNQKLFRSLGQ